ncbi:MAG: aminoglycoside phosphotransferase family protein [Flammeovirgaceae bacterium]|nr:MAG: aminoglycoside phosphotransferase family protein [Flammeovirgaceae bacterium]
MNVQVIRRAAQAFGYNQPELELLTSGLIHTTYKVTEGNKALVLQQINTAVFTEPDKIVNNYKILFDYLNRQSAFRIPEPVQTTAGNFLFFDEGGRVWRATQFIPNSYIENNNMPPEQAYKAAHCFGAFSNAIADLNAQSIEVVIPGFHNLAWRYEQFENALPKALPERLARVKTIVEGLQNRKWLVDFYNALQANPQFRLRIMHHDCKVSNILFDVKTKNPICPIDLDTVMPGYFFSDIGDLVRSVAGNVNETVTSVSSMQIRKPYYDALISGYLAGLGDTFTETEKRFIHHAGLLMIYMQCLRFTTDYLLGDVYYKVAYPEQNFHRSNNQYHLLLRLEEFLADRLKEHPPR